MLHKFHAICRGLLLDAFPRFPLSWLEMIAFLGSFEGLNMDVWIVLKH